MKRTIKFRGKFDKDSRWVYGDLLTISNEIAIVEENNMKWIDLNELECDKWHWVLENSIGQYTGLKDKNGVEIYEGDIISYDEKTAIVVWDQYITCFAVNENNVFSSLGSVFSMYPIEVIGNTFDNPGLIPTRIQ